MQRKYRKQLSACYQRARKRNKTLTEVRIDVTLLVTDKGRVKSVRLRPPPARAFKRCLQRVIKRFVFQPSGEQVLDVLGGSHNPVWTAPGADLRVAPP